MFELRLKFLKFGLLTTTRCSRLYLEKMETQSSISWGGFSLSGIILRPTPGENRARGEGFRGCTGGFRGPSNSISSTSAASGEAGEVGAVLSQIDKYGASCKYNNEGKIAIL